MSPNNDDTTRRERTVPDLTTSECRDGIHRIEKSVSTLTTRVEEVLAMHSNQAVTVAVMGVEIDGLKKWRDEQAAWQKDQAAKAREYTIAIRTAIISGVAGPILMLGLHFFLPQKPGSESTTVSHVDTTTISQPPLQPLPPQKGSTP